MVGIAGGVNPRQALAGPDEFEQRLLARLGRGGIVRIVQECPRSVVQEDQIVLLEILRGDGGGIVCDGCGPGAGLGAQGIHRLRCQRNAGVHKAGCLGQHQHLARLLRLGRRFVRQCGHHLLHVLRFGSLVLRCGTPPGRGRRRRLGQCGSQRGGKLIRRQRARPPGIAVGQPLGKGRLQFVARDKPVLIQVGDGEDAGSRSPASAAAPAGGGLLCLQCKGAGAQSRGANTNQQRCCRVFGTHDSSRVDRTSYQCLALAAKPPPCCLHHLLTIKGW